MPADPRPDPTDPHRDPTDPTNRPDPNPPFELTDRGFDAATGTFHFSYRLGDDTFTETFTLDAPIEPFVPVDHPGIEHLLDIAHLCVGVSYYKLSLPGRIVSPRPLHPQVAALVPHLYDHGLRELAVRNGLDVPLETVFDAPPANADTPDDEALRVLGTGHHPVPPPGPLVPFGGGKDSTLTVDLLAGTDRSALSIHATPVHRRSAAAAGVPLTEMRRRLDPLLAIRTAEGGWNGHVPITAINSSVSAIVAALDGRRDVVIANERSADEPTQRVGSTPVNHQYSKTYAFETALAAALAPTGLRYWSSMRRYSELAIAGALARRPELRNAILSCNRVFSLTNPVDDPHWCLDCAKCRFTFVSFAVFLDPAEATEMFGGNLLDDPTQIDGVRALWQDKPFDCVGELAESAIAVTHLAGRPEWRDTPVIAAVADDARQVAAGSGTDLEALLSPRGDDLVPAEYARPIDEAMRMATAGVIRRAQAG